MELNLKKFNKQQLEEYYSFLDLIIERFGLQAEDKRLVFNLSNKNQIVFTIGQRYVWITGTNEEDFKFEVISEKPISNKYSDFDGKPTAFWNKFNNISDVLNQQQTIFSAIEKELNRAQKSSYFKHNKKELEKMAFDAHFRKEVLDQSENQININELIKNINELMSNTDQTPATPLNQILFGAPGTGKTYHTKEIAVEIIKKNGKFSVEEIINRKTDETRRKKINEEYEELIKAEQIVFTTFHQSLSYEDFIEGIKPEIIDGNVTYEVKDGIFKSICKNAFSKEITSDNFEVVYQKLLDEIDNSVDNKLVLETLVHAKEFTIYKNSKNNIRFHSNTEKAYEAVIKKEVLEHYLKTGEALDWAPYTKSVANYIIEKYNYIQNEAIEPKKHVLIIDEINRGNVSAIFGELITLLEEDKRKGNKEHTEAVLPYSGNKFSVPNNVYIIGTMNTADRSVEALDTALRRRFSFVEMQPKPDILSKVGEVDLSKLLKTINKRIELLIDKDHQIGHSYFIGIEDLEDLRRTFKDKIIPLLEEYFYGDFGKIGLVLGGEFIKLADNQVAFPKNFTYENNFSEDKKIYHITSSKDWDEKVFKSIYGEVGNAK
jgi:mcrBC restriction endonuclease system, mcrB subunit, putative